MNSYFFRIFLILVINSTGLCAFGQHMQTSVDKKKILIGERIYYNIQFTFPDKAFAIEFNVPDSMPHFEVMGKRVVDTVVDNKYVVRQQLVITSWDSGKWVIPSFPIKIRNVNNNTNVYNVSSPIVTIEVGHAPADSTDVLRDIKPILPVREAETKWWYWALAALALLIIIYLIYRYFKNKPAKAPPVFDSTLTPYEEAMKAIKELESLDLYNKAQIKQYHSGLSEIFKKYLSRKKQVSVMQNTTGEILQVLREDKLSSDLLSEIANSLRSADAVKFAKYEPVPDQSSRVLHSVRSAIDTIENIKENKE